MEPFILITVAAAAGVVGAFIAWRVMARQLEAERSRSAGLIDYEEEKAALHNEVGGLRALSEVAYNALILLRADRRVIHMNTVARGLFAQPSPELDETLISITRNYELDDAVTRTLETGEGVALQVTIRGNTYRVQTLVGGEGTGRVVAVALEDVSELQRLGRARRDMVANISHELRTPITSIRLLVDTLERDKACHSKRGRRLLQKIAAEADTLEQMAQELLDLAMIESGRAEFILKPVALDELVAEAVELFSEQARRKPVTVTAEIPPELVALADAQQLRRALANLLHNAIKFTPEEGQVRVTAEPGAEWLTVAVTDTGPGIVEEERDRVFERFFRGDHARGSGGTGLGLAVAKHIVQAHGGRIWAEESPDPPGARICFTLPTSDE